MNVLTLHRNLKDEDLIVVFDGIRKMSRARTEL